MNDEWMDKCWQPAGLKLYTWIRFSLKIFSWEWFSLRILKFWKFHKYEYILHTETSNYVILYIFQILNNDT